METEEKYQISGVIHWFLSFKVKYCFSGVLDMLGWTMILLHLAFQSLWSTRNGWFWFKRLFFLNFNSDFIDMIREGVKKKNCEKAVRLTALWGGGHPPPAWPKLFVKILGLFSHWIWFLDTQNRFYFIVKRLKNAFLMYFYKVRIGSFDKSPIFYGYPQGGGVRGGSVVQIFFGGVKFVISHIWS